MAKFGVKRYKEPTPVFWRKVGDSFLIAGTTITGFAIAEETKWLAYASLISMVAGKVLTNFFSNDSRSSQETSENPIQ